MNPFQPYYVYPKNNDDPNVIQEILDRFRNPLLFQFLLTWIVVNWRAVFIILFESDKMTKFEFYVGQESQYWKLLVLPLLLAVAFVLIFPALNFFLARYRNWFKIKTSKKLQEQEYESKALIDLKKSFDELRDNYKREAPRDILRFKDNLSLFLKGDWRAVHISNGVSKTFDHLEFKEGNIAYYANNQKLRLHITGDNDTNLKAEITLLETNNVIENCSIRIEGLYDIRFLSSNQEVILRSKLGIASWGRSEM